MLPYKTLILPQTQFKTEDLKGHIFNLILSYLIRVKAEVLSAQFISFLTLKYITFVAVAKTQLGIAWRSLL